MTNSDVSANVLGTIGTVLWCIQLSPQIYFLWKHKNAEGFPPLFMFLWALSGIPFSIYFVMSDSYIPLQVQPQMFTALCSIAWIQAMYYPPYKYPKKQIVIYAGSFFTCALGLELGFGIWLKHVYSTGKHWPSLPFGILASILLAIGLVPAYFELFKRKGRVIGINFLFLAMDSSGAVFSMASNLVGDIDLLGMILYAVMLALKIGIFISQLTWWIRFRVIRKETDDEIHDGIHDEENKSITNEANNNADNEKGKRMKKKAQSSPCLSTLGSKKNNQCM